MSSGAGLAAPSGAEGQTGKAVDIKSFIDEQPISAFQWLLVALCFMVVVADGMDVAIMGFVTPSIRAEWNISRPAFAFVISAAPFALWSAPWWPGRRRTDSGESRSWSSPS